MTHLKHGEPITDLPSTASASTASASTASAPDSSVSTQLSSSSVLAPTSEATAQPPETPQREASADKSSAQKTSRRQKLLSAIARYPNVSQMLLFLVLLGGTSLVLLGLLFRGAWSDRDNNFAILSTILKMELNRESVRTLEEYPERVVTHNFRTLEPHVEAEGWTWVNRVGNTITYAKQDQWMIASCRPYSPLYIICELGEIPQ